MFEPIAIVGRACLLPGAFTPQQLWQNVLEGKNCLTSASAQQWGVDPQNLLLTSKTSANTEGVFTTQFGCIKGFSEVFDSTGFALSSETILQRDQLTQWLLHVSRAALHNANYKQLPLKKIKGGAILGNLLYPTEAFSRYAESIWLQQDGEHIHPSHRFMSGLPLQFLAECLNLQVDSYALDAACASALYAIKLACDCLQDGKADMMLAGGVNAADSLFLNMGFSALQALSRSGQSRPLHQDADGLIPAHGVAIVVLKRLQDAILAEDSIYGVIRGIGLSNDGNAGGFLVPAESGQVRAMQEAYRLADIDPKDVSWIECHATGTAIGDAAEIRSMQQIFTHKNLALGALKANIGHTMTVSGAAALINVLEAFRAKIKPATLYAADAPTTVLTQSPFRILKNEESWESKRPRIAAINCFGFGGNNAHLIVEEWQVSRAKRSKAIAVQPPKIADEIAIVGIGIVAAAAKNCQEFSDALSNDRSLIKEYQPGMQGGYLDTLELDIKQTRFPPNDLKHALGQQLAIFKACQEAVANVAIIDATRTAVLIGMQCDAEIARWGLRWRLSALLPNCSAQWLQKARDKIVGALQAADIIGTLPNVVANRINTQFNFQAPSFSIAAEELSGIKALEIGIHNLQHFTADTVIVGAVDLSCEVVHATAAKKRFSQEKYIPGDVAVALVLKRLSDAKRDNNTIYKLISNQSLDKNACFQGTGRENLVNQLVGYSYAASTLLHVAADALATTNSSSICETLNE